MAGAQSPVASLIEKSDLRTLPMSTENQVSSLENKDYKVGLPKMSMMNKKGRERDMEGCHFLSKCLWGESP